MASGTIPYDSAAQISSTYRNSMAGNASKALTLRAETNLGFIVTGAADSTKKGLFVFATSSTGTTGWVEKIMGGTHPSVSFSDGVLTISNGGSGYLFYGIVFMYGGVA